MIKLDSKYNPKGYRDALDILETSAKEYGSLTAFSCLGQSISYGEVRKHAYAFATFLQNMEGVERGDRVAVQLPNINQYPVASWGILCAGLVIVNVNPLYTERELAYQLKDSGTKVLITLKELLPVGGKVCEEVGVKNIIHCSLESLAHPIDALPSEDDSTAQLASYTYALTQGAAAIDSYRAPSVQLEDVTALQYTGGTTGVPKGAMLTHNNFLAHVGQVHLADPITLLETEEVVIMPLPLYHVYGMTVSILYAFSCGAHTLLIPNPREIDTVIDALKSGPFHLFMGINSLYAAMLAHKDIGTVDYSQVKRCYSGGTALMEDINQRWHKLTGHYIYQGYGLTECTSTGSISTTEYMRPGLSGVPIPGSEVKVVDKAGNSLPQGEEGELLMRGAHIMAGYWQKPEETDKVLSKDGWLSTGDIVVLEKDNMIRVVDRKKDMILVSGFNVYPNEIEDVITQHPSIMEAGAFAVEDADTGEAVKVVVVSSEPKPSVEELRKFCAKQLTNYKVPKLISFATEELPKTNVGKIKRRELAAMDKAGKI